MLTHPALQWNEAPPTPLESLLQAKSIAEHNGLHHIHLGNIVSVRRATHWSDF